MNELIMSAEEDNVKGSFEKSAKQLRQPLDIPLPKIQDAKYF
jgi:hypothetical protein